MEKGRIIFENETADSDPVYVQKLMTE